MKEITMKLYRFDELEESVRQSVVERERWSVWISTRMRGVTIGETLYRSSRR